MNPNSLLFSERERERWRERESRRSPVSDGAMMQGKLLVPGHPTHWIIVGQEPIALAVGADGGCLDIFLSSIFFLFFLPLWETARYRLKYCLKGPLNPK